MIAKSARALADLFANHPLWPDFDQNFPNSAFGHGTVIQNHLTFNINFNVSFIQQNRNRIVKCNE